MFYDRTVSARLLAELDDGGVFHGLVGRLLKNRDLLDLQLRGHPRKPVCWASLYLGLTSVLDLFEHKNQGFRLEVHATHAVAGHFDPAWRQWLSREALATAWPKVERYLGTVIPLVHRRHTDTEGRVQAALFSGVTPGFAVIDREAAGWFQQ